MSTIDNISGVDIFQIMDEEVDKKLEEDQDVIKRLIVQTRFTDEGKQQLHRNLRGLICDFADHQPGRYGDEEIDEKSEESRYEEKLKKLEDYYIIRYEKCELKDDCPICKHATVTTLLPSKASGPGFSDMSSDKIIPPQCTSRVSGDTFDCKYEFDKSEGQGTELVITCKTKNIIYLVTCQDCEEQFVGRTSHSSSLNSIDLLRDNDEVKEHQNEEDSEKEEGQQSDKCEKFSVQIIQKLPGSQTDGDCIDRERDQWIKKLMTYYPYGMNSRLEENEKPLYSEKFFDLFNDSSITSRKNKDEIVKELLAVLDSEDSRPISNFDSVFNIVAQSQNTDRNVRLDVKKEYIDGERNISNENKKLDDLIKDVLLRWCGVEYETCFDDNCKTCPEVDKSSHCSPSFRPDEKYDCIYEFSEGEEMVVSCTTEKVIYLLTCTQCKEQYVGLTKNQFKIQMNNYRSTRKTGQGPSELRKRLHDKKKDCPNEKFYSKIIQKLPRSMDKEDLKKYKNNWIEKLDTGLNVSGSRSKLSDKLSITAEMNRLDISDQNDFLPDKSSTPRK